MSLNARSLKILSQYVSQNLTESELDTVFIIISCELRLTEEDGQIRFYVDKQLCSSDYPEVLYAEVVLSQQFHIFLDLFRAYVQQGRASAAKRCLEFLSIIVQRSRNWELKNFPQLALDAEIIGIMPYRQIFEPYLEKQGVSMATLDETADEWAALKTEIYTARYAEAYEAIRDNPGPWWGMDWEFLVKRVDEDASVKDVLKECLDAEVPALREAALQYRAMFGQSAST